MSEKVTVISNSKSMVSVFIPELKLKRTWNKKGSKVAIDKETLEEAMYNPGVEYMFKEGILYIPEMQVKKELGLEPDNAEEPENIVILTDEQKKEWMSSKKQAWELKAMLEKLSHESRKDFCNYVIDNELLEGKKANVIKEICGVDVLRAIQLKQANEVD